MKNPKIISYKKFRDKRGYFSELFKKNKLKNLFIQDNLVFNKKKNTFRGLHYQLKPFDQGKLITVLKGSIIDYVTKINKKSQKNEAIKKFFLSEKDSKEIDKEIYEDTILERIAFFKSSGKFSGIILLMYSEATFIVLTSFSTSPKSFSIFSDSSSINSAIK